MRTAWARPLIGVALLAVGAAAFAPAALVDARVQQASEGRLRLSDASGWWWRGSGTLALADGSARMPIAWRVDVARLLRGTRVLDLHDPQTSTALGTIVERGGEIVLQDAHILISAGALAALDRRLATVTFGGALSLDVPMFTWNARGLRADGLRAAWERARIVVSDIVVDVGTVTVVTPVVREPSEGRGTGTIQNAGGDLVVVGTLRESANGMNVAATLRPMPSTASNVLALLPLLGTPDGTGGVNVTWHAGS